MPTVKIVRGKFINHLDCFETEIERYDKDKHKEFDKDCFFFNVKNEENEIVRRFKFYKSENVKIYYLNKYGNTMDSFRY